MNPETQAAERSGQPRTALGFPRAARCAAWQVRNRTRPATARATQPALLQVERQVSAQAAARAAVWSHCWLRLRAADTPEIQTDAAQGPSGAVFALVAKTRSTTRARGCRTGRRQRRADRRSVPRL